MASYLDVVIFSLIGGLLSLIGGVILMRKKSSAMKLAIYGTPFAAGALLAASFFELLPEAIESLDPASASTWVLVGLLLFFVLEHFIHWFHHAHSSDHTDEPKVAPLIIIGDSIHNLLDGIAIGAAFLIDVPTGIVTAIAVATHEIPQEVGDFGLLLKAGYSRKKVLIINGLSALMASFGALFTFWLGSNISLPLSQLLALTAGMFIYIAASDIIPHLHSQKGRLANSGAILLLLGVLTVGISTNQAHKYLEMGDSHDRESNQSEDLNNNEDYDHDHEDNH